MPSELSLYFQRRQAGNAGAYAGRLLVHDIEPNSQQATVALKLEFFPESTGSNTDAPTYWVSLTARLRTQMLPVRIVGSVDVDVNQTPPFPPTPPNLRTTVSWFWRLLPQDIETVERVRASSTSAPIHLQFSVDGIVQAAEGVLGVSGDGVIKIELSQWHRLLEQIGYSTIAQDAALTMPRA